MRAAAGINEPDLLYRNVILSEDLEMTSYEKLVAMRYWNEVYVQKRISETVASTGIVPRGIGGKVFSLRDS